MGNRTILAYVFVSVYAFFRACVFGDVFSGPEGARSLVGEQA